MKQTDTKRLFDTPDLQNRDTHVFVRIISVKAKNGFIRGVVEWWWWWCSDVEVVWPCNTNTQILSSMLTASSRFGVDGVRLCRARSRLQQVLVMSVIWKGC